MKENTCTNVVKASSSLNFKNSMAQSSTRPIAAFCLSASSKTESRYKNLCQIFCTFDNLNCISVPLNSYRMQSYQQLILPTFSYKLLHANLLKCIKIITRRIFIKFGISSSRIRTAKLS